MASKLAPQAERKSFLPIAFNAAFSGAFALALSVWVSFIIVPPTGWFNDHPFNAMPDWLLPYLISAWDQTITSYKLITHLNDPVGSLTHFLNIIDQHDLISPITWRLSIVITTMALACLMSGLYATSYIDSKSLLKHIRGRQLFKGKVAIRKARQLNKKAVRKSGFGFNIAPRIPISLEHETKHFLLVGASGSGKTQTLLFWIDQLLKQNTKMVLHDTKGDLTSSLPDDSFILLAPHDERSWAWDIAKDCQGIAAARELASRIIPDGKDPIWTNGAREIFTGIIRSVQATKGDTWSWQHLSDIAFGDPVELRDTLIKHHPEGANYLEIDEMTGTPVKTSYSFLVSLWSYIGSIISPLAAAWSDAPVSRRISLTDWLANEDTEHRTLILQRSAEFDDLSKVWISTAVQYMANFAASPSLGDSRSRRIWFILDEFAQLDEVKGFNQLLEVGRSKGIRSVIGVQDLEQLSDLYGEEVQKTWLNTIQSKIIFRMNSGPSANFIANDLIGNREVSWFEKTVSSNSGALFDGKSGSRTTSKQVKTATVPVIMPDYLERILGPISPGGETKIRALMLSHGDVFQLDWPLTIWPEQRPGTIPAKWIKG